MLRYRSLKDIVYDYISEQIRSKTLKPGEKINENIICDALEISRTPVREALIQLSNEGYIEQIPRRGFVVKEVTLERAYNIYAIIGTLEALAAVSCLQKPQVLNLKDMSDLVRQMDEVIEQGDYDGYYVLQNRFHETFIQASDNEDLIRILESLKKTFIKQAYNPGENEALYREALRKTNEEHKTILELFKAGDAEALSKFMRDVHWNIKYADMEIVI
jgi:DNA-binding GntR family transcriptional regulator